MSDLPLGKNINYPLSYDPSLLVGLNRSESRKRLRQDNFQSEIFGLDSWTCYELSWLNQKGLPRNNICLLYTSPSPRDGLLSRMPSSA